MLDSFSSLQLSLAAIGALTVCAVLVYNHWTSRKNEPRQADPHREPMATDLEPTLDATLNMRPAVGQDPVLDDANTERYAKLVTSMSKETQFLFISHNKIAMEMAEQLIGVTMQEQGVSRIVAVDMESAVSLADVV